MSEIWLQSMILVVFVMNLIKRSVDKSGRLDDAKQIAS